MATNGNLDINGSKNASIILVKIVKSPLSFLIFSIQIEKKSYIRSFLVLWIFEIKKQLRYKAKKWHIQSSECKVILPGFAILHFWLQNGSNQGAQTLLL